MLGKGLQLKTTALLFFFLWLIARAFNRSEATKAVALDISKAFRALARKLKLLMFSQNLEVRLVFTKGCHHCWRQDFLVQVFSIGITLVDVHLNRLNWCRFLILEGGLLIILIDCNIFLSPFLDVTRMSMWTVPFLTKPGSGILYLKNFFLWPTI